MSNMYTSDLKNKLSRLEKEVEDLEYQVEELEDEIRGHNNRISELEDEIKDIEEEIENGSIEIRQEVNLYSITRLPQTAEIIREHFRNFEVEDDYAIALAKELNVFEDHQNKKFD